MPDRFELPTVEIPNARKVADLCRGCDHFDDANGSCAIGLSEKVDPALRDDEVQEAVRKARYDMFFAESHYLNAFVNDLALRQKGATEQQRFAARDLCEKAQMDGVAAKMTSRSFIQVGAS